MSRRKKKSSRPPEAVELLEGIQEILLHVLLCTCCRACSGTGRAHVGSTPDGKLQFDACECRRAAGQVLQEFGLDVPGAEKFEEVER